MITLVNTFRPLPKLFVHAPQICSIIIYTQMYNMMQEEVSLLFQDRKTEDCYAETVKASLVIYRIHVHIANKLKVGSSKCIICKTQMDFITSPVFFFLGTMFSLVFRFRIRQGDLCVDKIISAFLTLYHFLDCSRESWIRFVSVVFSYPKYIERFTRFCCSINS